MAGSSTGGIMVEVKRSSQENHHRKPSPNSHLAPSRGEREGGHDSKLEKRRGKEWESAAGKRR